MKSTLYYNPQCSKCRATKEILDEQGVETKIIEYLKTPLDEDKILSILGMLGITTHQLVRDGDAKKTGIDYKTMSEINLIKGMINNPIIIQCPIFVSNGKARIGRPPKTVFEII